MDRTQTSSTQSTTTIGIEYILLYLLHIIVIHQVYKSHQLARVITHLHSVLAHTRHTSWRPKKDVIFYIAITVCEVIIVGGFVHCAVALYFTSVEHRKAPAIKYLHNLLYEVSTLLVNTAMYTTGLVFYSMAALVSTGYQYVLPTNRNMVKVKVNATHKTFNILDVNNPTEITERSNYWSFQDIVNSNQEQQRQQNSSLILSNEDVTQAASNLHSLHQFQRVFNEYFSLPATLIMLMNVIYITGDVFFLITMNSIMSGWIITYFLRLLYNTVLLLLLCLAPSKIHQQVSYSRFFFP